MTKGALRTEGRGRVWLRRLVWTSLYTDITRVVAGTLPPPFATAVAIGDQVEASSRESDLDKGYEKKTGGEIRPDTRVE